jgi:carboxypeptidase-like protein
MKRLYLLALFLFSIQLYSQELRVKITGKIKSDSTFVENVHIYNKTTNRGTISDAKGVFQIFVKSSDTLFFSNILFAKKSMIVNKKQIEKKFMAVSLNPSTNELEEIIIYNMAKSLGLPNADKEPLEPTERKINYYTKGGALNNIYGWLSGDKKKLKKLQTLKDADDEDFEKSLLIVDVRDQFQNEFFTKTLNITEENINDFISYCIDDNFIFLFSKERYIEIIDIFIKNRDAFLNSKQ